MRSQDEIIAALAKLGAAMPSHDESQRLAILAGNGLAQPMAGLRANQARREYERLAKRLPENHPRRVAALARAEGAKLQCAAIESEIERLSIEPKPLGEGEVGVHGYIRRNGEPLCGVDVVLLDPTVDPNGEVSKMRVIASAETGEDGSFALSVAAQQPLAFGVRDGKKTLQQDDQAIYAPVGRSVYRVEDVGGKKPADGGEKPKKPKDRLIEDNRPVPEPAEPVKRKPDPVLTADIKGRTLHNAVETLKEREIKVTGVKLTKGEARTPEVAAVENASRGASVVLHVATGDRPSARLDAMAALLSHDKDASGTDFETVSGARDWLRKNDVGDLAAFDEWSKLSAKDLQKKAKIAKTPQANKMSRALSRVRRLVSEG